MAKGTRFIQSGFGIKVLLQDNLGTYKTPTKTLCLEKDKSELPKIEYPTVTCKPMDDVEYDIITDVDNAKVTMSLDLALPTLANIGGVEDLLLACGMAKTTVGGDDHYAPIYALPGTAASAEVTTKRRTYQIKDLQGTYTVEENPGEIIRIKFELEGSLNATPVELTSADPDNAIPTNYLDATKVVWAKKKCGVTVGANTVYAKSITLDLGRQINSEDTTCGTTVRDSGMKSTAKFLWKMTELNEAPIADMGTGAEYALVVQGYDNTGAEKFQITAAKGKVSTPDTESDNDGYWDVERTFSLMKTTGNDNFELVFKA